MTVIVRHEPEKALITFFERSVEADSQLRSLGKCSHRERGDGCVGILGNRLEQVLKTFEHSPDSRGGKEICVVVHLSGQLPACLAHEKNEIEIACFSARVQR